MVIKLFEFPKVCTDIKMEFREGCSAGLKDEFIGCTIKKVMGGARERAKLHARPEDN